MNFYEFRDNNAGGYRKHETLRVYVIEAPDLDTATDLFHAYTGWWPWDTVCECCGSVFSFWSDVDPDDYHGSDVLVIRWADVVNAA